MTPIILNTAADIYALLAKLESKKLISITRNNLEKPIKISATPLLEQQFLFGSNGQTYMRDDLLNAKQIDLFNCNVSLQLNNGRFIPMHQFRSHLDDLATNGEFAAALITVNPDSNDKLLNLQVQRENKHGMPIIFPGFRESLSEVTDSRQYDYQYCFEIFPLYKAEDINYPYITEPEIERLYTLYKQGHFTPITTLMNGALHDLIRIDLDEKIELRLRLEKEYPNVSDPKLREEMQNTIQTMKQMQNDVLRKLDLLITEIKEYQVECEQDSKKVETSFQKAMKKHPKYDSLSESDLLYEMKYLEKKTAGLRKLKSDPVMCCFGIGSAINSTRYKRTKELRDDAIEIYTHRSLPAVIEDRKQALKAELAFVESKKMYLQAKSSANCSSRLFETKMTSNVDNMIASQEKSELRTTPCQ